MANVNMLANNMGESRERLECLLSEIFSTCDVCKKKLTGAKFDPNVALRRGKGRVSGGFPSRPV